MSGIKRWLGWSIVMGMMHSLLDRLDKLQGLAEGCYSWFSNPHHGALVFVAISFIVSGLLIGRR